MLIYGNTPRDIGKNISKRIVRNKYKTLVISIGICLYVGFIL